MMGSVSALRGRFVLIVEDEALIALDIAEEVSAHGAHACVTSTVCEALSALSRLKFAVAIVDHRLRGEDASEVIRRLEKLEIPFLIYSGYEEIEAWVGVPVVRKPAVRHHLMQTLSDLL
jgi:DNA-binding NtrC family response regulator